MTYSDTLDELTATITLSKIADRKTFKKKHQDKFCKDKNVIEISLIHLRRQAFRIYLTVCQSSSFH